MPDVQDAKVHMNDLKKCLKFNQPMKDLQSFCFLLNLFKKVSREKEAINPKCVDLRQFTKMDLNWTNNIDRQEEQMPGGEGSFQIMQAKEMCEKGREREIWTKKKKQQKKNLSRRKIEDFVQSQGLTYLLVCLKI